MQGKPLESVKSALLSILPELAPTDCFNIIAFNEEMYSFSSFLEPANVDLLESTTQWISKNLIACGGTNIMRPLNEVDVYLCLLNPYLGDKLFIASYNINVAAA